MKRQQGFTLIEIMIVVAILGILTALVYPSYQRYVDQSRRTDGRVGLLDNAQRLERCFTLQNSYANCAGTINANTENRFYTISSVDADLGATTFTLLATPIGVHAGDACGNLTLSHTGNRGVNNGTLAVAECW